MTTASRRAIASISDGSPALGEHLATSVVTGRRCSYQPHDGVAGADTGAVVVGGDHVVAAAAEDQVVAALRGAAVVAEDGVGAVPAFDRIVAIGRGEQRVAVQQIVAAYAGDGVVAEAAVDGVSLVAADTLIVQQTGTAFAPRELVVNVGDTVRWT